MSRRGRCRRGGMKRERRSVGKRSFSTNITSREDVHRIHRRREEESNWVKLQGNQTALIPNGQAFASGALAACPVRAAAYATARTSTGRISLSHARAEASSSKKRK